MLATELCATTLALAPADVDFFALARLELDGTVLRGRFRGGVGVDETESGVIAASSRASIA